MQTRDALCKARRWVVKVGSSLLTANGRGLDHELIAAWAEQITALRSRNADVVLVFERTAPIPSPESGQVKS